MATTAMATTTVAVSAAVFAARTVACVAYVALPIPRLVCVEVVELLRAASRQRSMVAMPRIEPVVHMPIEPMRPMEPRPRSDKDASIEPVRPIVAVRSAVIRSVVEVPIRAIRRHPYTHNNL